MSTTTAPRRTLPARRDHSHRPILITFGLILLITGLTGLILGWVA